MRTSRILLGAAACAAAVFGARAATTGSVTASQNDLNTLNYALLLERLESAFYNAGQAKFSANDFVLAGLTSTDYDYFNLIKGHEAAHVSFLAGVLGTNDRGACNFTLGNALNSVVTYVQTAATLENVGVSAYDGAINAISDTGTQQVAATIATIEARHSAFLNKMNQQIGGGTQQPANGQADLTNAQGAVDQAKAPSDVASTAAPFISNCPFTVADILPQVRPGGVSTASNLAGFKPSNANPTAGTTYTQAQYNNDNTALNYALVLENLEANFYSTNLAKFNRTAFQTYFNTTTNKIDGGAVYDNFVLIGAHEKAHAAFLSSALTTRGATPYSACTYDWSGVTDVGKFVTTASTLESTGVSAYDGAVNAFTDTGLQQAGATVATVEARHTSYINYIIRQAGVGPSASTTFPFPGDDGTNSKDTALAPSEVLSRVGNLNVQSCNFSPATPTSAPATGAGSVHAPAFALVATLLAAAAAVFRM